MEKSMSKFVQNGGTYRKVGDYYIPNITVPPEEKDIRNTSIVNLHKRESGDCK